MVWVIEMADSHRDLAAAQCDTWLQYVPHGHARFFSDTAIAAPDSCAAKGFEVHECCPGNASLGASIASAQYKREHIHMQLGRSEWAMKARWIVSTEQDTWLEATKIRHYVLGALEARPQLGSRPALIGSWVGPLMIFNRHMLAKGLGNVSYMDSCRALYYRCLARFPRGAPRLPSGDSCSYFTHRESMAKTKVGAFYNNDHFARFCAARLHEPQRGYIEHPRKAVKCGSSTPMYTFVHNVALGSAPPSDPCLPGPSGAALGWAARPPELLGFHHALPSGMRCLEEAAPLPSQLRAQTTDFRFDGGVCVHWIAPRPSIFQLEIDHTQPARAVATSLELEHCPWSVAAGHNRSSGIDPIRVAEFLRSIRALPWGARACFASYQAPWNSILPAYEAIGLRPIVAIVLRSPLGWLLAAVARWQRPGRDAESGLCKLVPCYLNESSAYAVQRTFELADSRAHELASASASMASAIAGSVELAKKRLDVSLVGMATSVAESMCLWRHQLQRTASAACEKLCSDHAEAVVEEDLSRSLSAGATQTLERATSPFVPVWIHGQRLYQQRIVAAEAEGGLHLQCDGVAKDQGPRRSGSPPLCESHRTPPDSNASSLAETYSLEGRGICPAPSFLSALRQVAALLPNGSIERAGGEASIVSHFAERLGTNGCCSPADSDEGPTGGAVTWKCAASAYCSGRWTETTRSSPLIVNVGEGTTGTRFLSCLMARLGLRTSHGLPRFTCGQDKPARTCTSRFDSYDYVSDSPISFMLVPLLRAHTGAVQVVQTLRDPWAWLESRLKHTEHPDLGNWTVGSAGCSPRAPGARGTTLFAAALASEAGRLDVVRDKLVYDAFALCLAKQEETGVEPVVINMFDESREEVMKKILSVLRAQKKVAVDESIVNWHWAACDKTAAHRRKPRPKTSRL